ncbi:hypothetical protein GQ44DRAFT_797098 [Phaeosphaeriaceae sp. PMI808]|nr:hypothetical protein GQ44DRAFT_797098 [Phaeosphaeriaceae sp. PMI808]
MLLSVLKTCSISGLGRTLALSRSTHAGVPDANKITYIGKNGGPDKENERNRYESGCDFKAEHSGSVCTNFPFSQKFSDKLATDWQCDEWPPAMSQQKPFNPNPKIRPPNSLRCMPGGENGSLGGKLGNYVLSKNGDRDDWFHVDFTTKIASANQRKVGYCLGIGTANCAQDGFQFGLKQKTLKNGKISSYYNRLGNDNRYGLLNVPYKELFQCGVKFTREGDKDFRKVTLSTWDNHDVFLKDFEIKANGNTNLLKGLPVDLQVKRIGNFGSKMEFEYAPGQANSNVNNFAWDSDMSGNGRGPWTDPQSDPNRKPNRFCKVVPGAATRTQEMECWFPCYRNANGQ